jgi:hypothetical protein
MTTYEKRRFLIWGKTAPELSMKYFETVCTGAVLEDGKPIRLYPIPFRYLDDEGKFKKYQWITARIGKSTFDTRPESYRIDCESIEASKIIRPDKEEWAARQEIVFSDMGWQFSSVEELSAAQVASKQSIGVVTPREIVSVTIEPRSRDEECTFEVKKQRVRERHKDESEGVFDDFVPDELKKLEFVKNRIHVKWICGSGATHDMQIMDWEVIELQRKTDDASALSKVKEILDLDTHSPRFFLGNLKAHPTRFTIVGLWYPKKSNAISLF